MNRGNGDRVPMVGPPGSALRCAAPLACGRGPRALLDGLFCLSLSICCARARGGVVAACHAARTRVFLLFRSRSRAQSITTLFILSFRDGRLLIDPSLIIIPRPLASTFAYFRNPYV